MSPRFPAIGSVTCPPMPVVMVCTQEVGARTDVEVHRCHRQGRTNARSIPGRCRTKIGSLGQCSGVVDGVKNSGNEPDQEQPRSIRAFLFDAEGADEEVRSEDLSSQKVGPRQLLWIDVDLRDPQALADMGSALPIEPESLQRMQESPSRPHLQDFEEYFHLNVQSLVASSEGGGQSRSTAS